MFRHYLIIIAILLQLTIVVQAQAGESILLPFKYDQVWNTDVINGRDDYGVHKDRLGVALDLYTNESAQVIAPISGVLEQGCVANGVTVVSITNNAGLKIRLIHLLNDTLRQSSGYINQGSPIAMTAPKGEYNLPGCNVSSDGYHVHMGIVTSNQNSCSYNIDGYNIECSGMRLCERSVDGSYALTFPVECNRKYLNKKFVSTNGFPLNGDQCDQLIKSANGPMPKDETNLLNLQVCLTKANLYFGVYTRQWDDVTKNTVNKYTNSAPQVNNDAENARKTEEARKAEEAKKAEDIRLAEESKKAQAAQLAQEQKEAEEYKQAKIAQALIEEESAKKAEFNRNLNQFTVDQNNNRNIIGVLVSLFMVLGTALAMLYMKNKKKPLSKKLKVIEFKMP